MKKILGILVTSFVLFSCTEDFINKQPLGVETNVIFYDKVENCELAVNAIYDPLGWESMYQVGMMALGDMTSDDAEKGGGDNVLQYKSDQGAIFDIVTFTVNPINGYLADIWDASYIGIARANAMLDATNKIDATNDDYQTFKRLRGEARFLRALYYFDLVRIYGPVPLLKQAIAPADAIDVGNRADGDDAQGTKQVKAIYDFIIEELEAIQNDVPWTYNADNYGRVTAAAAKALLAKAYLYKADIFSNSDNEYEKAYLAAKEVLDNESYGLEAKYQDIFDLNLENESSKEFIFTIQFTSGSSTLRGGEGSIRPIYVTPRFFINAQGKPEKKDGYGYGFNIPRQDLIDAFDANDPRLDMVLAEGDSLYCNAFGSPQWTKIAKVDWNTGYYCMKGSVNYEQFAGFNTQVIGKNIPVIRYADVMLIAAEAGFKDGGYKAEALKYVNDIRKRARESKRVLNAYNDYTYSVGTVPADLSAITLDDIKKERRLELYCEGHRFFDLVRWGDADAILGAITKDVAGYPVLWNPATLGRMPIPQAQINLHTGGKLVQNPGY